MDAGGIEPSVTASGPYHYVSPSGTSGGSGTFTDPWDLATALAGAAGAVEPGDTVWLLEGTYTGKFVASVSGTSTDRIVFRQFPGDRAILDDPSVGGGQDQFVVTGQWLVFWGFELMNSHLDRTSGSTSNNFRPNNVVNNGNHNRYVNLVIHDGGVAFFNYANRFDVEITGSVIYNNGWEGSDRGHGHGVYVKSNSGPVIVRDNVIFNQFGFGVHAYTNPGDGLTGILVDGNVSFNNGAISNVSSSNILLGGEVAAQQDTVRNNMTYFSPAVAGETENVKIGFASYANLDVLVRDNHAVGGDPVLDVRDWVQAVVTGNVTHGAARVVRLLDVTHGNYTWGSNTHYRDPAAVAWNYDGTSRTFSNWKQATGLGATDVAMAQTPGAPQVFVRPNAYEAGRANIIVYNWNQQASVQVDLSAVLEAGSSYEVHNVQDLFGSPVASGSYDGESIILPMTGVPPPAPVGGGERAAPHTGPAFDVFVVRTLTPPAVFSGAGNIASCSNSRDEATAALLDELPGLVFTLGDMAQPDGSAATYANCYDPSWGRHKDRTWASLGNHEYDPGTADPTFDYFGDRAGPAGLGYYSTDVGAWHVVVLNDNLPTHAGSTQEQWLVNDLAANSKFCTMAIWHVPLFRSSNSAGETEYAPRRILWQRLYAAGADLVVNGNAYQYERMAPMNPDGGQDAAQGVRQFIAGTGGEWVDLPTVAIHPNSEVRAAEYGVLKLTLDADGYEWEFVPIAGGTFTDSGTGACH